MSSVSVPTIKKLFGLSGNTCAFQDCSSSLIDGKTLSVTGEICHIKGKKPDSSRYDPKQTDKQRDAFENLVLMCSIHHKIIDDNEELYPVELLLKLKSQREENSVKTFDIDDETAKELLREIITGEGKLDKEIIRNYLRKIIEKTSELPKYLITSRSNQDKKDLFSIIRQKVEVCEFKESKQLAELNTQENNGEHLRIEALKKTIEKIEWSERNTENFERLIILGKPGIGKSWLLRYEAKRIAEKSLKQLEELDIDEIVLPVWVTLGDWATRCGKSDKAIDSLADLVIERFTEIRSDNRRDLNVLDVWLKRKIRSENCVILLDALDEIPRNIDFTDKLKIFSEMEAKKAIIYLTCREIEYKGSPILSPQGKVKEVSLLEFEDEQVKQFYQGWFGKDTEKANHFEELLEINPSIKELTHTPLLLSLLCALFDNQKGIKNFPQRRIEIYEQCVDRLFLQEWKSSKTKGELTLFEVKEMIGSIAFQIFSEIGEQFSERVLFEKVRDWLKYKGYSLTPETIRSSIEQLKDSGLITIASKHDYKPEETEYSFLHRTFLEYFVACGLANLRQDFDGKIWKDVVYQNDILYDPRWNEVLRLLGGKLNNNDAEEYIKKLLEINGENGEGDILYRPFILAMVTAKESEENLEKDFKERLLKRLTEIFASPPKHLHSYYFGKPLAAWKNGISDTLLEKLTAVVDSQSSFDNRYGAIDIVHRVRIKETKILEQIAKIVDETNSHDEKLLASITLCELGFATKTAVKTLIDMLLIHRMADTHFGYALLKAKEFLPEVINTFVKFVYLENISTFSTRHILQVLRYFNDLPETLVDSLMDILVDKNLDKHYFHEVLIDGLLNNEVTREANFNKLLFTLKDKNLDKGIRGKIARGIARYKHLTNVEVDRLLIFFIKENKESRISYELIPELAKLSENHPNVSRELIKFSRDKSQDGHLRMYSAWQLSELPLPPHGAVDFLLDVMNEVEKIPNEKKGALATLSRLKPPPQEAIEAIIKIVEDKTVDDETKNNLSTNLLKSDNPPAEIINFVLESAKNDLFMSTNGETKTFLLLKLENVPEQAVELAVNLLKAKMPSAETKRDICLELIRYLPENQSIKEEIINFLEDEKFDYYHRFKVANELLRFDDTRNVAEFFFNSYWNYDTSINFNMGTQTIQDMTRLHPFWLSYSRKTADAFLFYLSRRIINREHYWQDELNWENKFLLEIASSYKKPITFPN